MNTQRNTVSRKSVKALKPVIDVTIMFAVVPDTTTVVYAAKLAHKGTEKVITGTVVEAPMRTALTAVKDALKSQDVHLNVRHNSQKFHHWMYHEQGATQQVMALLGGVTASCNLLKDGMNHDDLVKQALAAYQPEPVAEPKTRKPRASKKAVAAQAAE
jgi:hypothetical protein